MIVFKMQKGMSGKSALLLNIYSSSHATSFVCQSIVSSDGKYPPPYLAVAPQTVKNIFLSCVEFLPMTSEANSLSNEFKLLKKVEYNF